MTSTCTLEDPTVDPPDTPRPAAGIEYAAAAPPIVPAPALAPLGAASRDAYAALRIPNYRRFAGGWFVSSMGIQMLSVAVGWELYERTGRALDLGYVGLVQALPVILFALP